MGRKKEFPIRLSVRYLPLLPGFAWRNRNLIKAAIDMAHALGLRVIAEGVEAQQQLDTLKLLGCDVAQGYQVCRPVVFERLAQFLEEHRGTLKNIVGH